MEMHMSTSICRELIARSRGWLIVCALIAAPGAALSNPTLNPLGQNRFEERVYIVQLDEPPALAYRGRPGGLAATRPAPGRRFDPESDNVRQYTRKLTGTHDELLRSVGAYATKVYSYRYAFNGFAARLTPVQAQKLRSKKNVLNVWEDQVRYLYTNDSPVFLGLFDSPGGLVADLGLRGDDIIIGIIDSGIVPEHPSFTDRRSADRPRLCESTWAETSLLGLWLCQRFKRKADIVTYPPPTGWNGRCETGERFSADDCNNKIIGARYYIDGFREKYFIDDNEIISPRDADGHGTHIASTAAGNEVQASLAGNVVGRINGIAPRARIAVYKACWLEPGQTRGSCATSDLQRAIDDAVADGVDIINYSIGNTDNSLDDPDDLALLAAADAGVLSIVAAGNDGPDPERIGWISSPAGAPWVLTVGASTRTGTKFQAAIRISGPTGIAGDYASIEASFTPPLRDTGPLTEALVLVDDGDASGDTTTYDACSPLVNSNAITGNIAFLQRSRSNCSFQEKLTHAESAGAVAAVVFNDGSDSIIIMTGTRNSVGIPAVLIGEADGKLIRDQLQAGGSIEVTLDKSLLLNIAEAGNLMANFSSRGPNLTAPDILKPDITAPGVNILAGHSPDVANGIRGENFQYLSGTSMSVPHIAGIAALIKQAHPDWTPAMIKSALMTTAHQDIVREDGTTPADPFDMGSGHVVANAAVDPGLVYDAAAEDYDAFICGANQPRVSDEECQALADAGIPTEAFNLNLPTIALGSLVSSQTIKRRVTNVGEAAQYRARVEAPAGIDIEVNPPVLSLGAGETAEYEVKITAAGAELYDWRFGALTWEDGAHTVRSPMAIRPLPFLAPLEVTGSGTSGQLSFDVEFGYTGVYERSVQGLSAPTSFTGVVFDDPLNAYAFESDAALPSSVARIELAVDDTDVYLRIALFNDDTDGNDDLDLYLWYCPGFILLFCDPDFVLISGANDSNELIEIIDPTPGDYIIDVHGFDTDDVTNGPGAQFTLFVWNVGPTDMLGNLTVTGPTEAASGVTNTVNVSWSGIDAERHIGVITHSDGTNVLEDTVIYIEN